ncbi:hypothetical protein D3C76_1817120 [compost metagenome]
MGCFQKKAVAPVPASSRASPLPQGFEVNTKAMNTTDHCGSEPAREGGLTDAIKFKD